MEISWGLVVPVKRLAAAKSRLQSLGDDARRELALAFALDVVRAALACQKVQHLLVVTDDLMVQESVTELGAQAVPDLPGSGHNAAVSYAVGQLPPGLGSAALSADLPSVTGADLADMLGRVARDERAFVTDAQGTGTTLLAAGPGRELEPSYGRRSRRAHLASGARELDGHPRLRQDVDTPRDLADAWRLGVGVSTTATLARLELVLSLRR